MYMGRWVNHLLIHPPTQAMVAPPEDVIQQDGVGGWVVESLGGGEPVPLSLPFQGGGGGGGGGDIEVDISSLLPRLLKIAERKGGAQGKVQAAETIHSLVLYLVGTPTYPPTHSSLLLSTSVCSITRPPTHLFIHQSTLCSPTHPPTHPLKQARTPKPPPPRPPPPSSPPSFLPSSASP